VLCGYLDQIKVNKRAWQERHEDHSASSDSE
jgi:hypothetical protein